MDLGLEVRGRLRLPAQAAGIHGLGRGKTNAIDVPCNGPPPSCSLNLKLIKHFYKEGQVLCLLNPTADGKDHIWGELGSFFSQCFWVQVTNKKWSDQVCIVSDLLRLQQHYGKGRGEKWNAFPLFNNEAECLDIGNVDASREFDVVILQYDLSSCSYGQTFLRFHLFNSHDRGLKFSDTPQDDWWSEVPKLHPSCRLRRTLCDDRGHKLQR